MNVTYLHLAIGTRFQQRGPASCLGRSVAGKAGELK